MRIGLIHKFMRPDTYGNYWLWAFRNMAEHDMVPCIEQTAPAQFRPVAEPRCDAYLRLDDSFEYPFPDTWHPLVYYLNDMHVPDRVDRVTQAKAADYVLCAQKNVADKLTKAGIKCEWMPHAAYFFPRRQAPQVDVASVMTLSDAPLFAKRTWIALGLRSMLRERGAIGPMDYQRMPELYATARIVWNMSLADDLPMRVLEGAGCGAAVVSSRCSGADEMFGDAIVLYDDVADMLPKLDALLQDEKECAQRAERMLSKALDHTYRHRAERLLTVMEAL